MRLASALLENLVTEDDVKLGESVGVSRRVRWCVRQATRGEKMFWSRVVKSAETVVGNTVMEVRRAMAEWRARGMMIALPI
jgi:alkylated DNA nucleotide flippase Atl1